jgi:hypothetical protein
MADWAEQARCLTCNLSGLPRSLAPSLSRSPGQRRSLPGERRERRLRRRDIRRSFRVQRGVAAAGRSFDFLFWSQAANQREKEEGRRRMCGRAFVDRARPRCASICSAVATAKGNCSLARRVLTNLFSPRPRPPPPPPPPPTACPHFCDTRTDGRTPQWTPTHTDGRTGPLLPCLKQRSV